MAPKKVELKPAADKLPLAVRKNIRDEWESKKPEFEEKLATTLGQPWTISTNVNLVYANADDESYKARLGSVIFWYMEPMVGNVVRYIEKYGDDGKDELNSICSQHQIEFGPQTTTDFSYGGLFVQDGVLHLVYNVKSFASNVSDVSQDIAGALKKASESSGSGSAFNLVARNSVRENYDPSIEEVQEKIGALVGVPDIKLNPNFEANAAALSKYGSKGRADWDKVLGQSTLNYFEGLASMLERKGFKDDDMLQEGFQEAVTKNEIAMRIVEKLQKGSYNDVVIADGVLYLETTVGNWWTNVNDCADKILDIL